MKADADKTAAQKLIDDLEAGARKLEAALAGPLAESVRAITAATHYRIDNDGNRTIVKPCPELEPVVFGADPVLGMTPQEFAAHVLHTTTIDRVREVAYCLEADIAAQLFEILDEASRAILGDTEAKS